MIEEFFIIGQGWSGWLRYYPNEEFKYVVHSCSNVHEEDLQLLKRAEDVEQYCDELDQKFGYGEFPYIVEASEDHEQAEALADGE